MSVALRANGSHRVNKRCEMTGTTLGEATATNTTHRASCACGRDGRQRFGLGRRGGHFARLDVLLELLQRGVAVQSETHQTHGIIKPGQRVSEWMANESQQEAWEMCTRNAPLLVLLRQDGFALLAQEGLPASQLVLRNLCQSATTVSRMRTWQAESWRQRTPTEALDLSAAAASCHQTSTHTH